MINISYPKKILASHPKANDKLKEIKPKTAVKNPVSIVSGINSSISTFAKSAVGEKYPKLVKTIGATASCAERV